MEKEQNTHNFSIKDISNKMSEVRGKISPEKEYLFGTIATYIYLMLIVDPESFPTHVQPMIELLNNLPMNSFNLKLVTLIAFTGSVDGARRIALERLPFYKAYLQVFLLNKFKQ